jgi:L-threonylcarbamoyladenylate synthase
VAAIYAAKGRPAHNPLIVHVADAADARLLAIFDDRAEAVAQAFWPGPLTLVLRRRPDAPISKLCTAHLPTVALRVPGHPVAHALLRQVVIPVAAPSANPSGLVSPTTAQHVAEDLGDAVDLVLDGGACPVGVESTVLDLSDPGCAVLLRPGGLPAERLAGLLGQAPAGRDAGDTARPRSPGRQESHYAPRLPVRLEAESVAPDEALLAFGPRPLEGARTCLNLSPSGDPEEAARNLFAMLRALDRSGAKQIAVMPIPAAGLGAAIRDRLARAAAPRSASMS